MTFMIKARAVGFSEEESTLYWNPPRVPSAAYQRGATVAVGSVSQKIPITHLWSQFWDGRAQLQRDREMGSGSHHGPGSPPTPHSV